MRGWVGGWGADESVLERCLSRDSAVRSRRRSRVIAESRRISSSRRMKSRRSRLRLHGDAEAEGEREHDDEAVAANLEYTERCAEMRRDAPRCGPRLPLERSRICIAHSRLLSAVSRLEERAEDLHAGDEDHRKTLEDYAA